MTPSQTPTTAVAAGPRLAFAVEDAEAVRFAAAPTVAFALRIESDAPVRSLALAVQIRLAAARRAYDEQTQARLFELFGAPEGWGRTQRSLLWTNVSLHVGAFEGATTVQLAVPCSYDLEVAPAKYLYAVRDGSAPLDFLFSGTVFYAGEGGLLRTAQVSWESEAEFALPVAIWSEAMERHFPGTAWLRLRRDVFDRLYEHKAARALPTWEAVFDDLLERP